MNEILIYLCKSSLSLAAFYGLYVLMMRWDTHYQLRRFYLVISLIAASVIPLIPMNMVGIIPENSGLDSWILISEGASAVSEVAVGSGGWSLMDYVGFIYLIGFSCMIVRLLWIGSKMTHLISKSSFRQYEAYKLTYSQEIKIPFSFFHYIFLPESEKEETTEPAILTHEILHARYKHSLDIVLAELHLLFFWFNPISWLFKNSIREVHEYQIDGSVLDLGFDKKAYQFLLLNYSVGAQKVALANSFNLISTKKRISMMNKKKSPRRTALKYLAFLPLAFMSLTMMSSSPVTNSSIQFEEGEAWWIKGKVINEDDRTPVVGAAILIKGSKSGTLTNSQGEFKMEVPQNSSGILQFSFVGLATYEVKVNKTGELTVYLAENEADCKHNLQKVNMVLKSDKGSFQSDMNMVISKEMAPLIVIDGKIVKKASLADLDPDKIESVNVLKGEKAIDAYGDDGKNGVVKVTMKKK